jgi:acyl transferase domain-containing protein/NADPH:quinone reductase-like Zn-dependent oxidoreductase/NADP-dependent 3-hydroxy acid dehydrogenase YdfG/acyl carrier protein
VIRAALAAASLQPGQVDAVEAHGTGTVLGDPIEAQALIATYGQDRPEDRPLWLGSVKSNIGHTQAAAGAAGVIKMIMGMRHGVLPPTLHAAEPSPHVDWSAGTVRLLAEETVWPDAGRPRRAGVSSFGMSGTNAHVIMEQAVCSPARSLSPARLRGAASPVGSRSLIPWVVSGSGGTGLRGQAGRLAGFARAGCGGASVADAGWSLAAGRSVFEERAVVLAADPAGFAAGLDAVTAGQPADGVITGRVPDGGPGKIVFVFPGQGGQWAGMTAELARACPAFAERLADCAVALQPHVDWPVEQVLAGPDVDLLERVDVVQPVLWAVMVALAAAWQSLGIEPDAVAGHSQGELAAATVAGILSLEDAARIVAVRSRALAGLAEGGGMAAVAWSPATAEERVAAHGGRVWVAAANSPGSVVLAGDRDVLAGVLAGAEGEGVRTRWLPVSYASHGPDVDQVAAGLARDLAGVTPAAGRVPFWSAVTGELADGTALDGAYWVSNLRERVRFEQVVRGLAGSGHGVFIEVSPHPVLVTAIEQTLEKAGQPDAIAAGTLRRDDGGLARLLASAAEVFTRGGPVDWARLFDGSGAQRVDLPTYAFQRQRFWPRPAAGGMSDVRGAGLEVAGHPLLAAAVRVAGEDAALFTGRWSVAAFGWLGDHEVFGTVLVPGTAVLELAAWVGAAAGCPVVEELTLEAPLVLPAGGDLRVQLRVAGAGPDGRRAVSLHSRAGEDDASGWTRNASGTLAPAGQEPAGLTEEAGLVGQWPPADAVPVPVEGWYEGLAQAGYGYGPAFRGLAGAWRRGDEVFAEVRLPDDQDGAGFAVHPALLDAGLHPAGLIVAGAQGLVPFSWAGVRMAGRQAGQEARELRVRLRPAGDGAIGVIAVSPGGEVVATADRLVLRPVSQGALRAAGAGQRDGLLTPQWVPVTGVAAGGGRWAVLGGDAAAADGLAAAGMTVSQYLDLAALAGAAAAGEPVPPVVAAFLDTPGPGTEGRAAAVRQAAAAALGLVQEWLTGAEFAGSVLVVVTKGAVAAETGERVTGLGAAAAWGLVRSAQSENPGQLVLADVDGSRAAWQALAGAVGWGEPELCIRPGRVLGRRLSPVTVPATVAGGGAWRLEAAGDGTLGGLARIPAPETAGALAPGQVRVAVRAAGLNFRDALITLGVYPGPAVTGSEGAGIVTGTGPGVSSVRPGDRVMGIWAGGLGPAVVADERMIAKMPDGWSFTQAASVPIVFATAYYALVDLAGLRPGESVLIHAAAGGVGMAAVQLARHLGAQVYATASPAKQPLVAGLGVPPARIESSRTTEFAGVFGAMTGGRGIDVVLDALAGEFVDASLGLVAAGGRFVEMGKADIRDPAQVAARWPGVSYRAFDLAEAGPARIGQILATVLSLAGRGILAPLPVQTWGLDQAGDALRLLGQGRGTGKNVVRIPAPLDRAGTVLITGASGVLAGLTARHLAGTGRAGQLLLASRRGPAAPGTAALAADLATAGTHVHVAACDAADRAALAALIGQVPAGYPLAGVFHTAGALDDGVIAALTPQRMDRVLAPKADAAIWLDELTAAAELSAFVLFSSAAATFGSPGQGNYAAANAVLDAIAADRRARGLPAVSIAWGMWEQATGLTAHLGDQGRTRTRGGLLPLTTAHGLHLLDQALSDQALSDQALSATTPNAVAVSLDLPGMRTQAAAGALPSLWHNLVQVTAGPPDATPAAAGWRQQLDGLPQAEQQQLILDLVRDQAAAVLGHASAEAVRPTMAFRDLGFDSLTAIELRNRLSAVTKLRLPATLIFDYPTPRAVAEHVWAGIAPDETPVRAPAVTELDQLESALSSIPSDSDTRDDITRRLQAILSRWMSTHTAKPEDSVMEFQSATPDEVFDFLDKELG